MPQVKKLENGVKAIIVSNCCFDENLKEELAKKRAKKKSAPQLAMSAKKIDKIEAEKKSKAAPSVQIWVSVEVTVHVVYPTHSFLGWVSYGRRARIWIRTRSRALIIPVQGEKINEEW
jgi:hypothetical protein